jgi:predicted transcriptional regulator of viral defense system
MHKHSQNMAKAVNFAKKHGMIRVRDAVKEGIHPENLRRLCKKGLLVKMARGIYIPADSEISQNVGLAQISKRVPNGVICLLSALQFHDIGTQSPFEVWVAIDQKAAAPRIDYPPIRIVRFSGKALSEGIEIHQIEGVEVEIYNKAKTIADCFKFRNKIGLDIALEALKDSRQRKLCTNDEIWKYAKLCRVSNVMKPYLEATL